MSEEQASVENPESSETMDVSAAGDTATAVESSEVTEATELEKYWTAVNDNPSDFTGWTYLLQFVEQEAKVEPARKAFDAFLARYPYCYGYWKKYADLEKKAGNMDVAEQVLERGVLAIPLSIDLWVHLVNFVQEKYKEDEKAEHKIRKTFERALIAAGTDFRSDRLWEMQINWEEQIKSYQNVMKLYDRLIAIPTQLYSHNFDNLAAFVNKNNPREILSLDEFLKLRQEVIAEKKDTNPDELIEKSSDALYDDDTIPLDGTHAASTEVAPPGEMAAVDTSTVITDDGLNGYSAITELADGEDVPLTEVLRPTEEASAKIDDAPPGFDEIVEDESVIAALREKIIEIRKSVHSITEQEVSRRWSFEEGIRRPYFHVKPLEKVQLKNWRDYLDMEMENGSPERTIVLYERCMIACALYEEFWMKYADYLSKHSADAARNVYKRACTVFLRTKPTIHFAWAFFEEKHGNFEAAVEILENLEKELPKLAMLRLRRLSLARRQGNFSQVEDLYSSYITEAESDRERSFYAIKRARYQAKVLHNLEGARLTIQSALENDKTNVKLYLQLLDIEYQQADLDENRILEVFTAAIESPLELEHKVAFSQRRLEFLEDFSRNVSKIQESYEEHQKLVKDVNTAVGKKRKSAETTLDTTQTEKKPKLDTKAQSNGSTTPTTTAATDYYNSAAYSQSYNQTGSYDSYGMHPPPHQGYYGQSWNAGYAPYNYHNQWQQYSNQYYPS